MAFFRRFTNLFRRRQLDRDVAAELQAHIDLRTDDNIARGMTPEEARREARLQFGNPAATQEHVAAADAHLNLEDVLRDLRYAARQLRHSPGFTLTAILTLAVGIGANVIVFGVLNAMLLRPLDVANSDHLFEVVQKEPGYDTQSYPDYLDYRSRNTTFSDMVAFRMGLAGLSAGGSAQKYWLYEASGNYFDMLGVQPALGRFFHASDERGPNSAPYVVLSDSLWRSRFNADPRVIGMTVDLNKHPFTIIGVAPHNFNGTELFFWPAFWIPMVNEEQVNGFNYLSKRSVHNTYVLGVTKPDVTVAQAANDLNVVARQLAHEYPILDEGMEARLVKPGLMADTLGGPARAFMAGLMALAMLVLLAACTNLAGIVAARFADRTRELAIRISIGSTRLRILRQLLTETMLVCIAGGAVGTAMAALMLRAMSRWQPFPEYPIHVTAVPDTRVYLIAVALSLASGILPGLLPARQIWRTDAMQVIKSGTGTAILLRRFTLRDLLLGVQIALCALLVTASLVALRGMERSLHAPIGIQTQGVMLADMDLGMSGYADRAALPLERRMIEAVSRIPGVTAVGSTNQSPLVPGGSSEPVFHEGTTDFRPQNSVLVAKYYSISPGYFHAAGTRLLAGRDVTWADNDKTPRVAVVNQTFARKLFGDAPAVGRHYVEFGKSTIEVVGIVEDGKYETLTEDSMGAIFYPIEQAPDSAITLVVRSQLEPAEMASALHRVLTGIDSSLPMGIHTWSDALALMFFPARMATAALAVMGLLAALLAVTGVFGMAAYTVSRRLRELGIRVALGARRSQLMRSALGRPLLVLSLGSLAGLVLGVVASRLLAAVVYQASPRDPLVLGGAVCLMALVGLVATWVPARRALSVDPARLLRDE